MSTATGAITELLALIPSFERHPLILQQPGNGGTRANGRLDLIVRRPFADDPYFWPIGVVSSGYELIPHTVVVDVLMQALASSGLEAKNFHTDLALTEFGERMALSIFLPDQYAFDPGDGHKMALRLECLNSVDGTTRFRVLLSWYRLVCSNGLVVGVTQNEIRHRHAGKLDIADVTRTVGMGLREAETDKANFLRWRSTPVAAEAIVKWVDSDVRVGLGFKAATRALHIARLGADADVIGQYRGCSPSTVGVRPLGPVPGTSSQSLNLYDVAQILAWLARRRRDLQEQLQWREQIPTLLRRLEAMNS